MKLYELKCCLLLFYCLFGSLSAHSGGLPPGWEFVHTPSTHIISIKLSVNPNINGFPIQPGDYIGAFYLDNNGQKKCGGAVEWLGNQNTGIIAYGDDSFTPEKDGFSSGELIHWKVYSWSVEKAYDAVVTCDSGLPSSCTNFVSQGLAGLATFDATGFFLVTSAAPENICQGDLVQLTATPSGGSGSYSYSWTSIPSGFSSNLANPQVYPLVPTQYIVIVSDGTEALDLSVFVSVTAPPYVSSGSDQTICENVNVSLSGIVTNSISSLWSTSGDGQFLNPTLLNTQYAPGVNDILSGNVFLNLTALPISPCLLPVTDQLQTTFQYEPQVDAGPDQEVCENASVILLPTLSYATSILWETNGDGFFDNPVIPETTYTPGVNDKLNGTVTLSITANAISPCQASNQDFLIVVIEILPEVNAGNDLTICQDDVAGLSGNAMNFSSSQWITSGDGSFENSSSLMTNYFPGLSDVNNGSVSLTLNVQPFLPCDLMIYDELMLGIVKLPFVYAGPDATVCYGMNHQVAATVLNFEELLWTTSGDGTFDDQNASVTFYYPGEIDILNGNVQLSIVVLPEFPCTLTSQDDLFLSFQAPPIVNAGDDATIHSDESYQMIASAIHYNSIFWVTSGDGFFTDPSIIDPVYSPGNEDISNGSVVLSLNAVPVSPCLVTIVDDMVLTIDSFTSINDSHIISHALFFPNPANSRVNFMLPDLLCRNFTIRVMDCTGKIVFEEMRMPGDVDNQNIYSINTENLINGLYFVQLKGDFQSVVQKVVIQHHKANQ